MSSETLVTVITVTRNDLQGLVDTSRSVAAQAYPGLQHLIVDGASTDGTVDWLASYKPECETTWSSEPDDGIFDAMNKGVERSAGEVLVFMNSGDRFTDSGVLSRVMRQWQSSHFRWGYGAMQYMDAEGKIVGETSQFPHRQRLVELGLAFAPHQATYVTKSLFVELGGFDQQFAYAADQEFAIRAGQLAAPLVWQEHCADFLTGGIHSQSTYWNRERLYHRMRVKNNACLFGSMAADRAFAEVMALYRESREWLAGVASGWKR